MNFDFQGELNTRPPQDGRINQAGYCNIATLKERRSFYRLKDFMMQNYSDLVLRVRGDGRMYSINVHIHGEFDIMWNDLWSYPLYTRGGPYWQEIKVKFKFSPIILRLKIKIFLCRFPFPSS